MNYYNEKDLMLNKIIMLTTFYQKFLHIVIILATYILFQPSRANTKTL